MIEVDARGLSCPQPVLMATDAMKKHKGQPVVVLVSTSNACENVQAAAKREKRAATVEVVGLDYRITLE